MQTIVRFSLSSLFLHFLFYSHSFEKYSFHSGAATAYSFPFFLCSLHFFGLSIILHICAPQKLHLLFSFTTIRQGSGKNKQTNFNLSRWQRQLSDTLRIDGWLDAPLVDFRKADSTVFHSKQHKRCHGLSVTAEKFK